MLGLLGAFLNACGLLGGGTASPGNPGFELAQAVPAGNLSGDSSAFVNAGRFFILDTENLTVVRLVDECPLQPCVTEVWWEDNETLAVQTPSGGYKADIDRGSIRKAKLETPTALARAQTAGAYTVSEIRTGQTAELSVLEKGAGETYRITGGLATGVRGSTWSWSPQSPLLALVGNVCSVDGFDLLTFDPRTGRLSNLTQSLPPGVLALTWHPSGQFIAIGGNDFKGSFFIDIVAVDAGSVDGLLHVPGGGFLIPTAWSPDGKRLLLRYDGGGGYCESGPPLPESTVTIR
jgi:hypothetical protein